MICKLIVMMLSQAIVIMPDLQQTNALCSSFMSTGIFLEDELFVAVDACCLLFPSVCQCLCMLNDCLSGTAKRGTHSCFFRCLALASMGEKKEGFS